MPPQASHVDDGLETGLYDAVLLVSFGGPDGPDDVMPFLENVLRGRAVPRERMLEVAEHYHHFGGKSPINEQNRRLIAALQAELDSRGPRLPIYWGNRNWHPLLEDTMARMAADGVRRAIALVTSGFSCYSGCRQYRENIASACTAAGAAAPQIDKIRVFFNHPAFVATMAENLRVAIESLGPPGGRLPVLFTAHSIPISMAQSSRYEAQLEESSRLVAECAGVADWRLVFQSRSGPPTQPWLEPDVCDAIRELHAAGCERLAIVPIGFVSDHMEVLYDLDTEAADLCRQLGMRMARAATAGTAPGFVGMLRDLIAERHLQLSDRPAIGRLPASHDVCPDDCCPAPVGRPGGATPANSARPS
ncbi:MAG: ferrochelatase [Planctomycetia bacterium]|nr:ferrochelatase [Planctomycetia bacterium]